MSTPEADDRSVVVSVQLPAEMLEQGKVVANITAISFTELVRRAAERLVREKASGTARQNPAAHRTTISLTKNIGAPGMPRHCHPAIN